MVEQDSIYSGYGFKSHVGYGTAVHRAAIEKLGVTPLHRLSFAPLVKYSTVFAAPPTSSLETASPRREPVSYASRAAAELASLKQSSLRREPRSPVSRASAGVFKDEVGERLDTAKAQAGDEKASSTRTTKQIGDAGETAAANYLVRQGHEIIERNWRTKFCEIDIVSRKDDTIYFTEVKYRKRAEQGGGLAAITSKKLRQMKFAAEYFALKNKLVDTNLRLCALSATGDPAIVETYLELE
jgi:uncharacterized protein (TIGR00252 family)